MVLQIRLRALLACRAMPADPAAYRCLPRPRATPVCGARSPAHPPLLDSRDQAGSGNGQAVPRVAGMCHPTRWDSELQSPGTGATVEMFRLPLSPDVPESLRAARIASLARRGSLRPPAEAG